LKPCVGLFAKVKLQNTTCVRQSAQHFENKLR
jgi:hypothetical protein